MKTFLAGVVAFAILDFVWLGLVMPDFYREQLGPIARTGPDGSLAPIWAAAVPVYLLIIVGLQAFVLPRARSLAATTAWGALFGLITYGVYDLTNYATLRGFPGVVASVDMAWGAFVCAATASAMRLASPARTEGSESRGRVSAVGAVERGDERSLKPRRREADFEGRFRRPWIRSAE